MNVLQFLDPPVKAGRLEIRVYADGGLYHRFPFSSCFDSHVFRRSGTIRKGMIFRHARHLIRMGMTINARGGE